MDACIIVEFRDGSSKYLRSLDLDRQFTALKRLAWKLHYDDANTAVSNIHRVMEDRPDCSWHRAGVFYMRVALLTGPKS